jgi:uncharacterized membrane protein YphA (DoxX/SURF4 family)
VTFLNTNSETTMKKNNYNLEIIVRILMAVIFLSAALYRIFNYNEAVLEMSSLKLPAFMGLFVILFEIVIGLLFIFDKIVKLAAISTVIFLSLAIIISLITNFSSILSNAKVLFIFNPEPTDIFLHTLYIAIIAAVFLVKKDR